MFHLDSNKSSRILIWSQRQLHNHVAHCCGYEFEDTICKFDLVDLLAPVNSYEFSEKFYRTAKRLTRASQFANSIKPDPNPFFLEQDYELFFAIFASPWEIISINSIKNRRKKCQKSVCYIEEIWEKDIPSWKPLLELLKDFDHIFLGHYYGTKAIADIIRRPCTYLPPSVDTVKFYPYPLHSLPSKETICPPHRSIDVCYLGRRSLITHKALLELAEQGKIFYYYDSAKNFHVIAPKDHRSLLANLIKRSRYFIANKAKINQAEQTKGQSEMGYRFFEGAAAGAVLVGDFPATEAFEKYFNWPDAAIRIPFDAANIGDIIAELDAQPERLTRISRNNVVNSLLQHDCVYRWREILAAVRLQPTPETLSREVHLKNLAQTVDAKCVTLR